MAKYKRVGRYPLPKWLSIEIVREGANKCVYINSTMHSVRSRKFHVVYKATTKDEVILEDIRLFKRVSQSYDLKPVLCE